MIDIRNLYAPLVGNNLKTCVKNGQKYITLFRTMRSMERYLIMTNGISTGAFAISNPDHFKFVMADRGIKIVIITWDENVPKAEEVPNECRSSDAESSETSSESREDPLTFHETEQ